MSTAPSTHPATERRTRGALLLGISLAIVLAALGAALPARAADVRTYPGTSDPDVTFTVPTVVTVGEDIVVTGTGWVTTDHSAGSIIAVKLDDGAISTTHPVTNPATGDPITNTTVVAAAQADHDGRWSATIPYPTADNSTSDPAWSPGQTHSIRLLTGSLLAGDRIRTETASFTLESDGPTATPTSQEPTAPPTTTPTTAPTSTSTTTPTSPTTSQSPTGPTPTTTTSTTSPPAPTSTDPGAVAPSVTTQPADLSVAEGATARFTAAASGTPAPTVQWQSSPDSTSWSTVAGATGTTLELGTVRAAQDGTRYRAVFTNAAGSATTDAATLTVSGAGTTTHTGTSDPDVTFTLPDSVTVGEDIVVTGTGWVTTDHSAGSIIAVKLDDGAISTTHPVTNPATGDPITNTTVVAAAQADHDGRWSATIPYPTADNSTSDPAWSPGQTHSIRLLTGSLLAGDRIRTETASFTLAAAGAPGCDAGEVTVSHTTGDQTATTCITRDVTTGAGRTIALSGHGWLTTDGRSGATVVVKLTSRTSPTGTDFQFVHTGAAGDAILTHPVNGQQDPTIWAVVAADVHGDFTVRVPVPQSSNVPATVRASDGALAAGHKLVVHLQSGLATTDTPHSVDSAPLVVDGTAYPGDEDGDTTACTASGPAQAHLVTPAGQSENPTTGPVVGYGETIELAGTGWCGSDPATGGSSIAVKIDDGAYSRRGGELVNANPQVWQIIEVDSADGSFDVRITLPSKGSVTGGSTPAMPEGAHTLRLLTGSLKAGDTIRTLETGPFTIGAYQPNGLPDVVEAHEDLTRATAHGVTATLGRKAVTVRVPGARRGDWMFLTAYTSSGSVRYPWGDRWFRADATGRVVASLSGASLPTGTVKLAVQAPDSRVLGWDSLTVRGPSSTTRPHPSSGGRHTSGSSTPTTSRATTTTTAGVTVPAAASSSTAPTRKPDAPFPTGDRLTAGNAHGVTGTQHGTVVTLTLPKRVAPGSWVYLYVYSSPTAVGWVQTDTGRRVTVDLALMEAGIHKVAALDADGHLVGWAAATVSGAETSALASSDGTPIAMPAVAAASAGLGTADLVLLGMAGGVLCGAAVTLLLFGMRRRGAARSGA